MPTPYTAVLYSMHTAAIYLFRFVRSSSAATCVRRSQCVTSRDEEMCDGIGFFPIDKKMTIFFSVIFSSSSSRESIRSFCVVDCLRQNWIVFLKMNISTAREKKNEEKMYLFGENYTDRSRISSKWRETVWAKTTTLSTVLSLLRCAE